MYYSFAVEDFCATSEDTENDPTPVVAIQLSDTSRGRVR